MKRTSAFVAIVLLWCSHASAIGPFEITAADSSATLRLQLAVQMLSAWESKDNGDHDNRDQSVSMKARRIRPTITVTIPDYKTRVYLHLSAAPGSIELMDLYFDTRLTKSLSVRAGQYKIPFTRYRIQSFQRLTFVDWSLVTRYFGAERQWGLALHNGYEKPPRYACAIGVFSGVNSRSAHAVGLPSVFGEKVTNPSDLAGTGAKSEFHPEIVGHIAYNAHGIDVSSDSDPVCGDLRYSLASSVAWDLDPTNYQDLALRVAPELLVKYHHVSFMGVTYMGFVDVNGSLRTRQALTGLLVQSAWRFSARYEMSLRFARVDVNHTVADSALARAAAIIDATDDQSVRSQYRNAGTVLSEREGVLGFNVYLDEHNLKLQNDIGFTERERRDGARTDWLIRSQMQLSF